MSKSQNKKNIVKANWQFIAQQKRHKGIKHGHNYLEARGKAVDAQRSVTERCQMGHIPNSEVKDSCVRELGSSNALDIGLLVQKLPFNGFGHRICSGLGEAAT